MITEEAGLPEKGGSAYYIWGCDYPFKFKRYLKRHFLGYNVRGLAHKQMRVQL